MNEKTSLTRRIAAAVRSALTPRRLRYLGAAVLAVLAVIAGAATVSAMTAPVPQRLVIDERAQAQIQRDESLFTAWAISRGHVCQVVKCDGPREGVNDTDEDYARVAFRRDLAPVLDTLPPDIVASLPPVSEWRELRLALFHRAAEYRAEAERQDNEVYELRYPKREVANDPWGLPDMGGVSDSCSFSGCTVEEEVQRAQRWFDRRDYDDIGEWNRVEEAGHTPDSLARFVRTQYNGDPMYAAAFTGPAVVVVLARYPTTCV